MQKEVWKMAGVRKVSVLLVEDDFTLRELYTLWLEEMNFRVCHASNGFEALQIIVEDSMDLVVSDIEMPRMNGLQFYREMQAVGSYVPLLFVTGHPERVSGLNFQRPMTVETLAKPVEESTFRQAVQKLLGTEFGKSEKLAR